MTFLKTYWIQIIINILNFKTEIWILSEKIEGLNYEFEKSLEAPIKVDFEEIRNEEISNIMVGSIMNNDV